MEDTDTVLTDEEAMAALVRDDGLGMLVARAFSFEIPPFAASFKQYGGASASVCGGDA